MKFSVKLGVLIVLLHTFTYIIIGWASVWPEKVKMINKDIEGNYSRMFCVVIYYFDHLSCIVS